MSHGSQVARESPGSQRGQPDDARLIAESCRVPERFGAVFDRHATAIHGYIARRLGRDAADDLVAETFLVAFRQRASYEPDQPSARPWLYGIATRLVSRRRRDEVRFFRAIARSGIDPAADAIAEPVADQSARRADAQALHRRLAGALAVLSTADRDALLLVADGLSYAEAAQALGVPPGTLSSRLARARRTVREELGGVNPADERQEQGHE
ncbi:MAG TPA: RNA polymerase sigma factor [Streptosporangiaceae bacterium]|nr:RNA polymerase sigma factor [Streptosporangiaceae bacterium]